MDFLFWNVMYMSRQINGGIVKEGFMKVKQEV